MTGEGTLAMGNSAAPNGSQSGEYVIGKSA
jgi:hypothetical protein